MSFSTLDPARDVASLVSSINEVVAITGSIYSNDLNVKFYKNIASGTSDPDLGGYFQTIYDASPTSSLSTALFDVTFGIATGSAFNLAGSASASLGEKVKMYRQFASLLMGNPDSLFNIASVDRSECFFLLIKRNLQKDELKKGTISLCIDTKGLPSLQQPVQYSASDQGAVTAFKQTLGGDYAPLKAGGTGSEVGQVWYNAGIVVIPALHAFGSGSAAAGVANVRWSGSKALDTLLSSGSINNLVDGFRTHVERLDFHNQTNLHSTVFFCRATNREFNYSSNQTFVDANKRIRVTSGSNVLQSRTYVTTIGLYDANDNLLAVGKVNKPIAKSFDNEATFRGRIDY